MTLRKSPWTPNFEINSNAFCRVFATADEQESAKELIQTSLNDWLSKSEEAVKAKNDQAEASREKQMDTLLEGMKDLSSRVQNIEKLKKKELDSVTSSKWKSGSKSKSGVLSSTTFKSELKQKVRRTLGSIADSSSDSSRPTSPVEPDRGSDGASGEPTKRSRVYFHQSTVDTSKKTISDEISTPDTPFEDEFAACLDHTDSIDEPDSIEVVAKSRQINVPGKSEKIRTVSSNILSSESRIPATRPPSPPPPPKDTKLPPPRNLIY